MKKKIDSPFRKLRMLLVLPLVAMVFYAFAKPEYITPTNAFPTDNVTAIADGNDVKGKVVKADGKPLHGTSVIVTGTTVGTMTDVDGNFKLNSVAKDAKIAFSFVGFKTAMQNPDFNQPMTITMITDTVKFEEGVVAVGYGIPAPASHPSGIKIDSIDSKNPPLYVIDGVITEKRRAEYFLEVGVESANVLKGKAATDKYGEKAKNGAVEITLKKPHSAQTVTGVDIKSIDWKNPPLLLLDGITIEKAELDAINPKDIESINVLKSKSGTDLYGEKGKNGVILINLKKNGVQVRLADGSKTEPAMYFVDGQEKTSSEVKSIDPNRIESMNVLKGEYAVKKYGEKGREGVIEIKLKSANDANAGTSKGLSDVKVVGYGDSPKQQNEKEVFVVVEELPEFPGGEEACKNFIVRNLKYPLVALNKGKTGKVFVTFIVNKNGKVENAKVVMGADPALDKEAVRVISSMPDWKPGKQRGTAVDVVYTMPIEFMLQ